ncbi:hypothetical protein ABZY09_30645 [Streptomyces sp. NPDC002928]|uniref:hypothetical protein n=1 Tax=Streptomyces sp. NPDC002928 TaxID=3154440 RepID=UPI0033BF15A0
MTNCKTCGRPPENGQATHWLGCDEIHGTTNEQPAEANGCEHDGCSEPKKPWSGKGARPKYCAAGHKKEK